jgi:hypothetical protein
MRIKDKCPDISPEKTFVKIAKEGEGDNSSVKKKRREAIGWS